MSDEIQQGRGQASPSLACSPMSETPETDALEIWMDQRDLPPLRKLPKYAQLARRLERERDEARREAQHLRDCFPPDPWWPFPWENVELSGGDRERGNNSP